MFHFWVSDRMSVSLEGKKECLETAKIIMEMVVKVRERGILALEDDIQSTDSMFLKTALQLTVDGLKQEEIRKVLENWIVAGNYRGRMLLKRILIMEGMIAIQQGCNPAYIYNLMASYFGEDFFPKYKEYLNYNEIVKSIHGLTVDEFFGKIKGREDFKFGLDAFNGIEILGTFDDMAIQILVRETNFNDLIVALKGSSENVIGKFLSNMSKRNSEMTMESCLRLIDIRNEDIIAAQNRIMDIVKSLEKSGQIVRSNRN